MGRGVVGRILIVTPLLFFVNLALYLLNKPATFRFGQDGLNGFHQGSRCFGAELNRNPGSWS